MANDYNCCTFTGRLSKDPETRFLPDGKQVTNFTIAVGESWKTKDGEKKEKVEWVPVTIFGGLASVAAEYLSKGKQVLISGKLQTRSWDDKDGNKKYMTEVIADRMVMLGSKSDGGQGGHSGNQQQGGVAPHDDVPDFDDSVPF